MILMDLGERKGLIIPDIYDLTQFNKKTHNIVVNLRYNESAGHIEITYDGHTSIETNFTKHKSTVWYNCRKSVLMRDFMVKHKMGGYYKAYGLQTYWQTINYDSIICFYETVNIYFYKSNIPPEYEIICTYDDMMFHPFFAPTSYYLKIPFIIFSDDIIELVPYFDTTKMKYIKKYTYNVPDSGFKLVYMIYKFHNMVFIYNSHIIENDRMEVFTCWDKEYKCFNCNFDIVPKRLYFNFDRVNFQPIVGEFKHTLFYRYGY